MLLSLCRTDNTESLNSDWITKQAIRSAKWGISLSSSKNCSGLSSGWSGWVARWSRINAISSSVARYNRNGNYFFKKHNRHTRHYYVQKPRRVEDLNLRFRRSVAAPPTRPRTYQNCTPLQQKQYLGISRPNEKCLQVDIVEAKMSRKQASLQKKKKEKKSIPVEKFKKPFILRKFLHWYFVVGRILLQSETIVSESSRRNEFFQFNRCLQTPRFPSRFYIRPLQKQRDIDKLFECLSIIPDFSVRCWTPHKVSQIKGNT